MSLLQINHYSLKRNVKHLNTQPNCVIILPRQFFLFKNLGTIIILGRESIKLDFLNLSRLCFPYNKTLEHIAIRASTRVKEPAPPTQVGGVSDIRSVGAECTVNGSLGWLNSDQSVITTGSLLLCHRPFFKAESLCCYRRKVLDGDD